MLYGVEKVKMGRTSKVTSICPLPQPLPHQPSFVSSDKSKTTVIWNSIQNTSPLPLFFHFVDEERTLREPFVSLT